MWRPIPRRHAPLAARTPEGRRRDSGGSVPPWSAPRPKANVAASNQHGEEKRDEETERGLSQRGESASARVESAATPRRGHEAWADSVSSAITDVMTDARAPSMTCSGRLSRR